MPKSAFLNSLFDARAQDLSEVMPDFRDTFFCPICLYKYTQDAIGREELTDGHVWWKDLRRSSNVADRMSVLLCKTCNNLAGSRGDNQAQLLERIKKGDKSGNLHGKRLVKLAGDTGEPFTILADIVGLSSSGFTLQGPVDKDGRWLLASPEEQERFIGFNKNQERVKVEIYQHPGLSPTLGAAGWITSAYLMAFYALGYRYILRRDLNPVRDYIKRSFNEEPGLEEINQDDFSLATYPDVSFPDPELKLIFPFESGKRVHIQVSCLTYQVRLPFRFMLSAFQALAKPPMQPGLIGFDALVTCTKTNPHHCIFDDLMGDIQPRIFVES